MIHEGDLLWRPGAERIAHANLTRYRDWLQRERGLSFPGYAELHQWSVDRLEDFWQTMWDYFGLESATPYATVLAERRMPGADWFPGATLNYSAQVFHRDRGAEPALYCQGELQPLTSISWNELGAQVRAIATRLRQAGVAPGDRVVGYLPNIPEAAIALLATAGIGAIWSASSPDFGTRSVLDRFKQIDPKVLFCVDGYRYGGRDFDRRADLREIIAELESLEHVICLPYANNPAGDRVSPQALFWDEFVDHAAVSAAQFQYQQVPFGHPLWILFSSGTTGLPKPIVHSHGGIILEQHKLQAFHMDIHPHDRVFTYTTSGWMMWNFLVSCLLSGAQPVLYDGHPAYPEKDVLWSMAAKARTSFFGTSPSYVQIMQQEGIVPRARHDLSALQSVMLAGSPVSPECMQWFYENVKQDFWVQSGTGGTDICSGFVGGIPTQPVYAGEIQVANLGVDIHAYNDAGEPVIDEVGEMVIRKPMPSMPICFWNDPGNQRYLSSYFEDFPGVWRHGDFFRRNARGGCFVQGRSDSTLNRYGVRIGTAEIYRTLERLPEVADSIITNLDLPGGKFFMPLFVKLQQGLQLDEELHRKICAQLRSDYSPRHVPDRIYQVQEIPRTLTGKKMEVPVRKILLGVPMVQAANRDAMANPHALDYFVDYARTQTDYSIAAS